MDYQPLVLAVAGVLIALTPVAVAYLTMQVRLLGLRADALERAAQQDRVALANGVAAVAGVVRSNAAETQRVVRDQGGKAP
jgi:hypothetical protein